MLVAHPKPMHRRMKRNRRCDFSARRIGRDDNDASGKVLGEVVIASQQTGLA
jgi:hypothetical protein